jgi:hypothetical protein
VRVTGGGDATAKTVRHVARSWVRHPMLAREMEIQHRVPNLHVAEEQLNRPEVRATFQ